MHRTTEQRWQLNSALNKGGCTRCKYRSSSPMFYQLAHVAAEALDNLRFVLLCSVHQHLWHHVLPVCTHRQLNDLRCGNHTSTTSQSTAGTGVTDISRCGVWLIVSILILFYVFDWSYTWFDIWNSGSWKFSFPQTNKTPSVHLLMGWARGISPVSRVARAVSAFSIVVVHSLWDFQHVDLEKDLVNGRRWNVSTNDSRFVDRIPMCVYCVCFLCADESVIFCRHSTDTLYSGHIHCAKSHKEHIQDQPWIFPAIY